MSPAVSAIRGSVYSTLLHRLSTFRGEVYPLHVGDTWRLPPEGCRMEDLHAADAPGMHQYTPPQGMPALVDAVVARMRERADAAVEREGVCVSGGATAGLAAAVGTMVQPGDEVLLLAPHWPLIDGIVRMFGALPVPVPFFGLADSAASAVGTVEAARSERTVALYVNTPNNPTGRTIPLEWLEALVVWARRHDIWLLFDEVYEDYDYAGKHPYGLALAPERAISAHSFSKAYGMAGYRCGFLVGPADVMKDVLKIHTHTTYSAPTASQLAALRVLDGRGDRWAAAARTEYRAVGEKAAARLGLPAPDGSTFLFLDVAPHLKDGDLLAFLDGCSEDGIFAAPGPSFGPYPSHIRICYTAAPPDVVLRGVEKLALRMGRSGPGSALALDGH